MRKVGDWIKAFVEYTKNTEAPLLYRQWAAVSSIAACLQRKCSLRWGLDTFFPNMYIVLVGPSGCRKGTAIKPACNLLMKVPGIEIAAESTTRQALIRDLRRSTNTIFDSDTGKMKFHSSLTIFSEELTVFLGYNNLELISNLVNWYDCGRGEAGIWTYDTVSRNKEEVIGIWVNMIGATTPELIQSSLPCDAIGGGLSSRMIYVYEGRKGKSVPLPFLSQQEIALGEDLVSDLEEIVLMTGEFKIHECVIDKYVDWYMYQESHKPFNDPRFSAYFTRRASHVLKLCMIMNAARSNDMIIQEQDFDNALALLEATEKNMPKTFSGMGMSEHSAILSQVMAEISLYGEMRLSQIMQRFYYDADRDTMNKILGTLTAMKFCQIVHADGDKGDYTIRRLKDEKEE